MTDDESKMDSDHELNHQRERPSKRQRVARACTNCRRRKARCDGTSPCEPCRMSNLVCTYEAGGRMTSTEYIQSLERKVSELESLLGRPGASSRQQSWSGPASGRQPSSPPSPAQHLSDDDVIETMIDAGEVDAQPHDSPGSQAGVSNQDRDPHNFGGLSLLRRVHKLCRHVSGLTRDNNASHPDDDLTNAFEVAPPESDSSISWEAFALLPSRDTVAKAIDTVINEACCNMQFLDRDALNAHTDKVFEDIETDNTNQARTSLALLYSVLALARQFNRNDPGAKEAKNKNKNKPTYFGIRYFRASRALLDPAACSDLVSLRTLLCMIVYTCSASMLSTCYSYICMAVAASLQMGLFTELADRDLPDGEKRTRRIIFAVLYITDTYVTTALGLPRTLRDIEPERGLPSPVKPDDVNDPLFGTYLHAQLIQILAVTVESNHPFTRPIETKNGFYGVEYGKIVATEERLEAWFEQVLKTPQGDQPAEDHNTMRSQLLLRLYYAHVQMVLYRPFLHHALRNQRQGSRTNLKAYACGSACIKAAMQAVWLVERLEASSLFNPAQWFVVFIITFTSACLSLFVTSNAGVPTVDETADAVRRIKELCSRHAHENDSLRRCLNFLEVRSDAAALLAKIFADGLQSLPPNIPKDAAADLWHTFAENTSQFTDAYQAPEEHPVEGDDVLQALSLPQLRSFLNCRL